VGFLSWRFGHRIQPCRFEIHAVNFNVMTRVSLQDDVTILELGSAYESLDDDALEEVGGLLLTKAATVDPPLIVLDLSGTRYIGSTFIELMVRAWKRLRERGGSLTLCCLQPFCSEVLKTTRLDTLIGVFATREEAVAAITRVVHST